MPIHEIRKENRNVIPFMQESITAGFPSPAQDYMEDEINLHELLVPHPLSSFVVRAVNDSMMPLIPEGALLVVDKSLKARSNNIIVGFINGDFTLKRFIKKGAQVLLRPENKSYPETVITEEHEFSVWAVVTQIIIDPNKIKC